MPEEKNTQEKILESAGREFLKNGFQGASLRTIAKNAGVTTGAMYRYYDGKEALFAALVDEHVQYLLSMFRTTLDDFEQLPGDQQTEQMLDYSRDGMFRMLDYIYDHYDAFKLLLECAEGTRYSDFIHQLAVYEEKSTYAYIETMEKMGCPVRPIHKNLIHMLSSGLFSAMFEVVVHDLPKAEAEEYLGQMRRFYSAGWSELMGIQFGKPETGEKKDSE